MGILDFQEVFNFECAKLTFDIIKGNQSVILPLFHQMGILDFQEVFNFECAKLTFDIIKGNQSVIFDNFLKILRLDMAIKLVNQQRNIWPFL